MAFKINISSQGKTFKLETDDEGLIGRKIGELIDGRELKKELEGYELEITGTSDMAGFPGFKEIEGSGLKKVLLVKGFGLKRKPRKEGKRGSRRLSKGTRIKKSLRGSVISKDTIQINTKTIKSGNRSLEEIFPEQNKPKEKPVEQKPDEEKKEEVKSQ